MARTRWQAELEKVRAMDPRGILRPEAVVEFARDPSTALHSRFEWDDTEAARLYRIDQARQIIRVAVTVIREDKPPVRAYVSLQEDRATGGGYRSTIEAMKDDAQRQQVLAAARAEMRSFLAKYTELTELEAVFEAMQEAVV